MIDTLISFETAKLAKEKGFNLSCLNYFYKEAQMKITPTLWNRNSPYWTDALDTVGIPQPTQSLLRKWLREAEYDIIVTPQTIVGHTLRYQGYVTHPSMVWDDPIIIVMETYEEVLESCLLEALKLHK